MKVLHVVPAYHPEGPGGIEVYVRELCLAQRARGDQPMVLTGRAEPRPIPTVESREVDGIPVLHLHRDDLWFEHHSRAHHAGAADLFARVLTIERPDVVHVHHWLRLTCDLVAIAERCGIPAVVTLHDTYSTCPRLCRVRPDFSHCTTQMSVAACSPCVPRWAHESDAVVAAGITLFRDALSDELARARAVIAVSGALADFVEVRTGLDRAKTTVLAPCHAPRTEARPLRPIRPNEPLRFGHWGNLGRHKGTDVLLSAVRELVRTGPPRPFELHVLGRPESTGHSNELADLATDMPVVCHGPYDFGDLAAVAPHCGVFPFLAWETHSFVIDECFGLGLPCIASHVGAIPERTGLAAILVPPGDVLALAAAMRLLLREPDRIASMAAVLPGPAPTADVHATAVDEIYRRALAAPPSPLASTALSSRWATFRTAQWPAHLTDHGLPQNVWAGPGPASRRPPVETLLGDLRFPAPEPRTRYQ